MTGLVRLATGMFRIENSFSPDTLKMMSKEEIEAILIPVDAPLTRFSPLDLERQAARDFTNGKTIELQETSNFQNSAKAQDTFDDFNSLVRVYYGNEFIGVGRIDSPILTADKVFNTRLQNESI